MTNDELKAIYEYMGWWEENGTVYRDKIKIPEGWEYSYVFMDSNHAWLCVQEMERKGDWCTFEVYSLQEYETLEHKPVGCFLTWFFDPANFFGFFGKWCLERGDYERT